MITAIVLIVGAGAIGAFLKWLDGTNKDIRKLEEEERALRRRDVRGAPAPRRRPRCDRCGRASALAPFCAWCDGPKKPDRLEQLDRFSRGLQSAGKEATSIVWSVIGAMLLIGLFLVFVVWASSL